jgi:hypothetical protein
MRSRPLRRHPPAGQLQQNLELGFLAELMPPLNAGPPSPDLWQPTRGVFSRVVVVETRRLVADPQALKLVSAIDAWAYEVLPLFTLDGSLWLAVADSMETWDRIVFLFDEIQFTHGYASEPLEVPRSKLLAAIAEYFGPRPLVM